VVRYQPTLNIKEKTFVLGIVQKRISNMTLQEILERIEDVLNQGTDTESGDLDLLRHDLENFIIEGEE